MGDNIEMAGLKHFSTPGCEPPRSSLMIRHGLEKLTPSHRAGCGPGHPPAGQYVDDAPHSVITNDGGRGGLCAGGAFVLTSDGRRVIEPLQVLPNDSEDSVD